MPERLDDAIEVREGGKLDNPIVLSPEEFDAFSLECDNCALTIQEQGVKGGKHYTVAVAEGASPPFRLTAVTRANGLVDVQREDLNDSDEWVESNKTTREVSDPRVQEAAMVAAGVGENPDEDADPLGHLPDLKELDS